MGTRLRGPTKFHQAIRNDSARGRPVEQALEQQAPFEPAPDPTIQRPFLGQLLKGLDGSGGVPSRFRLAPRCLRQGEVIEADRPGTSPVVRSGITLEQFLDDLPRPAPSGFRRRQLTANTSDPAELYLAPGALIAPSAVGGVVALEPDQDLPHRLKALIGFWNPVKDE